MSVYQSYILLIFTLFLFQSQRPFLFSSAYDLVSWTVFSLVRPRIQAVIQTEEWRMNTETGIDASLSVLNGSYLILTCSASYPVIWSEENQTKHSQVIQSQARNCYPFVDVSCLTPDDEYLGNETRFPIVNGFRSVIKFRNITKEFAATYTCTELISRDPDLSTSIRLDVHSVTNANDRPEILQTGFDKFVEEQSACHSMWHSIEVSLVYTAPPDVDIISQIYRYYSGDSEAYDAKGNRKFQEYVGSSNDTTIRVQQLSRYVNQATFTHRQSSGDYRFVIESRYGNKTLLEQNFNFTIESQYGESESIHNSQVDLYFGRLLDIRMCFIDSNVFLKTANFKIKRYLTVWEGSERWIDLQQDCMIKHISLNEGRKDCGILGISLINESIDDTSISGVRIILNVTNPFLFEVETWTNTNNKSSYTRTSLASTVIRQFVSESSNGITLLVTDPPNIGKNDNPLYANDKLTLRCLVPICHMRTIAWCHMPSETHPQICATAKNLSVLVGDRWTHEKNKLASDPSVTVSSSRFDSYTMAYNLTFDTLKINHSGFYGCTDLYSNIQSTRGRKLAFDAAAKINLIVEAPLAPTFRDGERFGVEEQVLNKNGTLILSCECEGRPKPEVSWSTDSDMTKTISLNYSERTFLVTSPGIYKCFATNRFGINGRTFKVRTEEINVANSFLSTAIAVPLVTVLISFTILLWYLKRRALQASFKDLALQLKNPPESGSVDEDAFLNDQVNSLSYNRSYEIDYRSITMENVLLGQGEFGNIFKGEKVSCENNVTSKVQVAIKVPKNLLNLQCYQALIDELKIMCCIRPHVNILALVGACTDRLKTKQLFVLTEFCENGSLRNYLLTNDMRFEGFAKTASGQFEGAPGAVERLINYSYQASKGTKHLADENIIHRDLALRNLLLTSDHIVKISDFGMSRRHQSIYCKPLSPDVAVPMLWMSIESLISGVYTQKSDVWSFGILLWEMFSCGKTPYPAIESNISFGDFCAWLLKKETNRLDPPTIACDEMYQVMLSCWKENPELRPTFKECKRSIGRIFEKNAPIAYRRLKERLSKHNPNANGVTEASSSGTNSTPAEFIDEFSGVQTSNANLLVSNENDTGFKVSSKKVEFKKGTTDVQQAPNVGNDVEMREMTKGDSSCTDYVAPWEFFQDSNDL